jgi:hypothetical protein
MPFNLKTVPLLNHIVDAFHVLQINVKRAVTLLTPEMVVLVGAHIIPLKTVQKRNLAQHPFTCKVPKIPVNGGFAYGRILPLDLTVHFFYRWVSIQLNYGVKDDFPLWRIPLHLDE